LIASHGELQITRSVVNAATIANLRRAGIAYQRINSLKLQPLLVVRCLRDI
jgi:hypothetical protein